LIASGWEAIQDRIISLVPKDELKRIATTRLGDARVLLRNNRYDGAGYLCGYAVEVTLKFRVCEARNWEGQPENERENLSYRVLMTHDLERLLQLANVHREIKGRYFKEWSIIRNWNPAVRYHPIGNVSRGDAEALFHAATILLNVIAPRE
jgi:HEPN domain-containing protein